MTQLKLMLDLYDELEAANPSIDPLVEALENEMEFTMETWAEEFDALFLDNGIAVNTYETYWEGDSNLTEAEKDQLVYMWQNDKLKKAFLQLCKQVTERN